MYKYFFTGILIIVVLVALIGCCGTKNTVSGTVFISGNEPFTYLALKGEDDTYYKLECEESVKKELWSMQGQTVKLRFKDLLEKNSENIITVTKILSK